MILLDRVFGNQNEPATVAGFLGDPLDGVIFEVEKGSQGFGKALLVLLHGLIGGVFDAKTAGFGVHPLIQLAEAAFHLGIAERGETNNTTIFREFMQQCPVAVGGVVCLVPHAHLAVTVLAVQVAGADRNGVAIHKLDGDSFPCRSRWGWPGSSVKRRL